MTVTGARVRPEFEDGTADAIEGGTERASSSWTPDVETRAAAFAEPIRSVLDRFVLERDRRSRARSERRSRGRGRGGNAGVEFEREHGAEFDPELENAARIAIVPDVHYPYHPSTGMVTDPAVVAALAAHVAERTAATCSIVGSSDHLSFERTTRFLGYRSAIPEDVSLVDLDRTALVERTVDVDGDAVSIAVPDRLLESTVIAVPTLRPTCDGAVAGAMRTLGRQVRTDSDVDPATAAVAAARAIDPALAVLDATVAYAGRPVTANALFAGACVAVDAVAAESLGRTATTAAPKRAADGDLAVSVHGLAFEEFRSGLPSGGLPEDAPRPLAVAAYRRYADLVGDAVPPQFESAASGTRNGSGRRDDRPRGEYR